MPSKFITRQINEIKSMKLPRSLYGFIYLMDMDRQNFTDHSEWQQFCVFYKAMLSLQEKEGFDILAARLISFIQKYRPQPRDTNLNPSKAVTRKERRRLNKDGPNKAERHLAKELRKAKPSSSKTIEDWNATPRIGLGIQSTLRPPPKTRRDQVKIDAHTSPSNQATQSHILYVAGWTMTHDDE